MASPIENIKNGILNQDWSLVKQAYQSLTGESIGDTITTTPKKRGRPKKESSVRRTASNSIVVDEKQQINKFVDDLTLAADEIQHSKKLSKKKQPTPRDRPKYQGQIELTCDSCGSKFKVEKTDAPVSISEEKAIITCQRCMRKKKVLE